MAISPLPPQLDQLGRRRFSFYPPLLGIEQNQWLYGGANWSEIQVINAHTGVEVWIPRRFVGEVSRVDEPVLIVGLKRELEFREGVVLPHRRHIIEFPVAVNDHTTRGESAHPHPAVVVNIRLEPSSDARAFRKIAVILVLGVVACSIVIGVARNHQNDFHLNRSDDYASVVRKLGLPAEDRTTSDPNHTTVRTLEYPGRRITVVLAGPNAATMHYLYSRPK